MREISGRYRVEGRRFAVAVSRTNDLVTRQLLNGALDCLRQHGADEEQLDVYWVPGTWELALMPIDHRGTARLVQSGALVSGTYELEGGWSGSLQFGGSQADRCTGQLTPSFYSTGGADLLGSLFRHTAVW